MIGSRLARSAPLQLRPVVRSSSVCRSTRCLTTVAPSRATGVTAAPKQSVPARAASTATASTKLGSQLVNTSIFAPLDTFSRRHVGPEPADVQKMLSVLGYDSLDSFVNDAVPSSIRIDDHELAENPDMQPLSETEMLRRAKELASENIRNRDWSGGGYHNAVVPPVILRNMTENHAWFSQYSPYQPEISQGRLESLINFQTLATSLTGLDISNASLLDEATAAAEAMIISYQQVKTKKTTFLVDRFVYPQTLAVLKSRAAPVGIQIKVGNVARLLSGEDPQPEDEAIKKDLMGVLIQYPDRRGQVVDWSATAQAAHELGALVTVATDLLALTLIKPPGEWGADMAIGNTARFGVPVGFGGPHAAFFSCTDALKRKMPGRLIGLSRDANAKPAYRMALQTREQHIRREKATSNICTAQALLANMAAMYAVYHGPEGLKRIALKVHGLTSVVKAGLASMSQMAINSSHFDTLTIRASGVAADIVHTEANKRGINLGRVNGAMIRITLDESTQIEDIVEILNVFATATGAGPRTSHRKSWDAESVIELANSVGVTALPVVTPELLAAKGQSAPSKDSRSLALPSHLVRTSDYLTSPTFNSYHSETELLRYMHHLQEKDLSLVHASIFLGSCTMKLNPTAAMTPLTWPEWGGIHPFAPTSQTKGYTKMMDELSRDLCAVTGFPAVSLQPNSGAQGEYTGLSCIRAYHHSRGDEKRDICLIPLSAHGTNPASAIMAGMKVVPVKTLVDGALDMDDLKAKAEKHSNNLAAFMVTYPSTFGVFEDGVKEACEIIHSHGGQVYLDGANLNAQLGLTNPATCGADVCHMNLHKTFAIPHGGGGPGVGPIGVASHLAPFLPGHPVIRTGGANAIEPVTGAPYGSASILTISWAFIRMLGGAGLKYSAQLALLNANYMAHRLKDHYRVKYSNSKGLCAHEFIIDLAEFDKKAGLKVADFAKRLQDYGFHPPTCSWPLTTAMLIEPTESESKEELDRFCEAMIKIKDEANAIADGQYPRDNNMIRNAPHPVSVIALGDDKWNRPYTRQQAAFPDERLYARKFWPSVGRLDEAYGDLNVRYL
ncbi:hypothetical protein E5Q_04593 [Mixia osmundae IAM 14324]|uniref:glycine dehydrogenase (aminomethyl-transferring) n=1 Tax=Mixia osmundae (strain CBS 9802 / IAM 14324 / JCM 22182 / KY 12970) TaxID=764103 RepID=G7E503_MIXOS|nr:hypothetical protein E5Q_04593 [Mixia osmundae IAM 14324]